MVMQRSKSAHTTVLQHWDFPLFESLCLSVCVSVRPVHTKDNYNDNFVLKIILNLKE